MPGRCRRRQNACWAVCQAAGRCGSRSSCAEVLGQEAIKDDIDILAVFEDSLPRHAFLLKPQLRGNAAHAGIASMRAVVDTTEVQRLKAVPNDRFTGLKADAFAPAFRITDKDGQFCAVEVECFGVVAGFIMAPSMRLYRRT